MGVSGGAVLPPIQAVIHDHSNVNISFVITLVAYVVTFFYGLIFCRWIKYVDEDIEVDPSIQSPDNEKKEITEEKVEM
jgi:FHS family L-fucose permease-like MFS transporter